MAARRRYEAAALAITVTVRLTGWRRSCVKSDSWRGKARAEIERPFQYRSTTKFPSLKPAWSSYLFLSGRLGSLTVGRFIFLKGTRLRMCEMQLSRARRLSSDRTMYQGACL